MFDDILSHLQWMDQEAIDASEYRPGLRGYLEIMKHRGHRVPGGKRAWENAVTEGLANRLKPRIQLLGTQCAYPFAADEGMRGTCDLQFHRDGTRWWIENKLSWRSEFVIRSGAWARKVNASCRAHLVKRTAYDFEKLARLTRSDADQVGVLLIGFDDPEISLDEYLQEMLDRVQPAHSGWQLAGEHTWPAAFWSRFYEARNRVWLWTRTVC